MQAVLLVQSGEHCSDRHVCALNRAGFKVSVASSNPSGLLSAQAEQPTLILCDESAPLIDGFRFLTDLRRNPRTRHIPCILLTEETHPATLRRAMTLGADDVLERSTPVQELMEAVFSRIHRQQAIAQATQQQRESAPLLASPTLPTSTAKSAPDSPIEMHPCLLSDLAEAIHTQTLEVYYQPQIDSTTHQVIGVEALLRWCHPRLGWISPDIFIPLAEDSGLIDALSEWVLRQACPRVRQWQALYHLPLKLSINLSARQLTASSGWDDRLIAILGETGFDPRYLTLEITETSLIQDLAETSHRLTRLRHLGIQIALDDFGMGYSCLSYLNHLPIDLLKIDRDFVNSVTFSKPAASITCTILSLAKQLNLATIAEGVETPEQMTFLQRHGCYVMQGYFYSPALSASAMQLFFAHYHPQWPAIA